MIHADTCDAIQLQAVDVDGKGLRIVFRHQGDRYGHEIFWTDGDREVGVLRSCEGTSDQRWPLSPPWQSLELDGGSMGRPTAFLLGMAGNSHWSMSVQVETARRRAVFDVACRLRQPPDFLGTSYEVIGDCELVPYQRGALVSLGESHGAALEKDTTPIAVAWDDAEAAVDVHLENRRIELLPNGIASPFPTTVRWKFEVFAP